VAGKRKAGSGDGRSRPPAKKAAKKPTKAPAKKPAGRTAKAAASGLPAKKAGTGKREVLGRNGKIKQQRGRGARIRQVLLYVLLAGLVFALVAVGGFVYLYKTTKLPDPNADFETNTSFVYYDDGKGGQGEQIGQYAVQNRDAISYKEMPQDIKDAVVAAENRTFWSDSGIDYKGIVRALFNNAQGNATQGASTITQQYIKILYLTQERTYTRKLKEAILSLKLGKEVSKQQILEGYLNTIYFGRGAYGIQAAAKAYFDKDASDLSLQECATLASIINNPSQYNPDSGKDAKKALRERYRYVLDGMASVGKITEDEAKKAGRKLPKFYPGQTDDKFGGQRGHVLTMVKDALTTLPNKATGEPFTESEIDGGGLRITTTFTKKAMDAAENGVNEVRPEGKEFSDKNLHIGVASVDVATGAIRGIFAGQDYLQSQINWAIAGGQAGSSVKPFSLAAALKAGYSLKDTFDGNSPYTLENGDEIRNEQDTDYGSAVNLIKATEDSINTAFTDLTVSMPDGPQKILEMMNKMGIPPNKGPGKHYGERERRAQPLPEHHAGQRDDQPDQHGQRVRHHRQRRPVPRAVHHREGHLQGRRGPLRPLGERPAGHRPGAGLRHRRRRQLCAPAGRAARHRHGGAGPRPAGGRQDRHRDQRARPGRLGVVHRLHAADGDLGHVRPRQGQRAARRLAAVVLRRRLPRRHLDRGHEARHGGRGRRGVPAAGVRRR
jgi:membrane peptidoglycan carboxypeptidase